MTTFCCSIIKKGRIRMIAHWSKTKFQHRLIMTVPLLLRLLLDYTMIFFKGRLSLKKKKKVSNAIQCQKKKKKNMHPLLPIFSNEVPTLRPVDNIQKIINIEEPKHNFIFEILFTPDLSISLSLFFFSFLLLLLFWGSYLICTII